MRGETYGDTTTLSDTCRWRLARTYRSFISPHAADKRCRRNDALPGISAELTRAGRPCYPRCTGDQGAYQPTVDGGNPHLVGGAWPGLTHTRPNRWALSRHLTHRGRTPGCLWRTTAPGRATCSCPCRHLYCRRATDAYCSAASPGTPGPVDISGVFTKCVDENEGR